MFMGWVIASKKFKLVRVNPQAKIQNRLTFIVGCLIMFNALRRRLLLSYLGVMIAVLGTFCLGMYQFFRYSLYQELDRRMLILADASAHSLPAIQTNPNNVNREGSRIFDNDGDLDIPWQDLRLPHQSVEWFDPQGKQLAKTGKEFPQFPLILNFHTFQTQKARTLTVPVYPKFKEVVTQEEKGDLQGFVRVSESIVAVEEELNRLLWGLEWGGSIAFLFCAVGGVWLTRQSLQPIEQSFQTLKQFTADASHELRNPLTAIKTSVQLIQSHPERIHPNDFHKLKAIESATNQMTYLVEDLLFLARTDGNQIPQNHEWIAVPVDEIIEDLVELLIPQAEAKGIALKSDLSAGKFVKGNAAQLRRLFANLLDNAVQYTPSGGTVKVSLNILVRLVVIRVEDTGIGIAPSQIPLIFDRFWRADQARNHREGGSGLGLAIAQAIAQKHGGEISVSSKIGVGSCFEVRLPLA